MNRLQKAVVALLASAAIIVPMAGASRSAAAVDKTIVTLMTWENIATNTQIATAMRTFEKLNPSIHVQMMPTPNTDYYTKLSTLLIAKKLPDLFWSGNDWEQTWGAQRLLYNYSVLAKTAHTNDFEVSRFAPTAIENWSVGGQLYGLPSLMNTYGYFYNADALKAAKLPLPAIGWTYKQFLAAAQALTIKSGATVTRYGVVSPFDDPFNMSQYAVSAGGQPFANKIASPTVVSASPQFKEGTALFVQAIKNGWITPPTYTGDSTAAFLSGKAAMMGGGQWIAAALLQSKPKFAWGFAPTPLVSKRVQIYDAVGIASPVYIANPEAVWKVLTYLDSKAWEVILPGAPVAPPAYVPAATPYYNRLRASGQGSTAAAINEMLTTPTKVPVRFMAPWAGKAATVVTAHWNDILLGKAPLSSIDQMVQEIRQRMQVTP